MRTKILIMSFLVAFGIEKTVALPKFDLARFTQWDSGRLTVFDDKETGREAGLLLARPTNISLVTGWSRITLQIHKKTIAIIDFYFVLENVLNLQVDLDGRQDRGRL